MSKKDYQAIARALYINQPYKDREVGHVASDAEESVFDQWRMDRDALASVFADDNPRFDRARFVEACETGKCKGMPR